MNTYLTDSDESGCLWDPSNVKGCEVQRLMDVLDKLRGRG